MKTAAAALAICLGLGCAAAGPPGDAAAGQPLEKRLEQPLEKRLGQPLEERLERARRLSADACATETTAFSTCLADASITFTPATPAGPWASCDDVQAEVTGICDAGPTACEVEYHTYTECLYEYMLTSTYGAGCDVTCASSTRTPAPTPADFRDLDGDGVADVPEGDCCIHGYGMSFSSSPGCGTLAEAAKTCCPWPRLARYSLQQTGEDKTAFDCVSFVSKEKCAAQNALWSDDSQLGPGGCAHSAGALKSSDAASASGPALLAAVLAAAAAAL